MNRHRGCTPPGRGAAVRSHRVLLFAGLREALGPSIQVALPERTTVRALLSTLGERHPAVRAGRIAVAVNLEVVPL